MDQWEWTSLGINSPSSTDLAQIRPGRQVDWKYFTKKCWKYFSADLSKLSILSLVALYAGTHGVRNVVRQIICIIGQIIGQIICQIVGRIDVKLSRACKSDFKKKSRISLKEIHCAIKRRTPRNTVSLEYISLGVTFPQFKTRHRI